MKTQICTSLEQSKKLAEILPLESADMYYWLAWSGSVSEEKRNTPKVGTPNKDAIKTYWCPCWSLAALLGVLPFHLIVNNQRYAFSMHKGLNKDGETYMLRYNVFYTDICLYSTDYYNSPLDACVAMIEKLNELKML